ncbi:alpha/beta hydrolase [Actinomadura viridis]|uniref:Polyhydroxyalkanoate synthase n=1 Tax=Actinomadura viridis TaxID=58110 RepID=A0A931DMC7_9ACTN|nr:alpha/beta fold hydrolase [Actinomadura viridis]MBG6091198.1 polyhydroxyalkanoate synthase [Actinomadura viridis]
MILSPRSLGAAASNVAHKVLHGQVADLRPVPSEPVGDGPRGTSLHRYRGPEGLVPAGPPVLFVPPPAVPARCYDLRRGGSLAEHVVNAGRRSYLLDHGPLGPADRAGDAAEWVREVLPEAIRAVSRDAGGQPVQLVGWCAGGLVALLTAAAGPALPIASVAMIAAPVDPAGPGARVPPPPLGARLARGVRAAVRDALPRPVAGHAGRLAALDEYLLRSLKILVNLDNTDFLAQIEAVDHFSNMLADPSGRAVRRMCSALLPAGATATGKVVIGGRPVDLDRVGVPVLAIAGRDDALAPVGAVRPVTRLLPGAPEVRVEVAPGGHLGVLTGASARTTTWAHLDRWLDEGIVRHGIRAPRRDAAATV